MNRNAFSMLELIFVIIVMGILAKFGVELFKQTYEGYARSLYINELQTKSANAIQTIANRLTYRIKDSINSGGMGPQSVTWKGLDIDGWLGNEWSGIIDLDASTSTALSSPDTSSTSSTEIFFVGSNIGTGSNEYFTITTGSNTLSASFTGEDVYEYYQMTDGTHTIAQNGATLTLDNNLLVDNVSEFMVEKLGDGVRIHLCLEKAGNPLLQGKVCKDKFVL